MFFKVLFFHLGFTQVVSVVSLCVIEPHYFIRISIRSSRRTVFPPLFVLLSQSRTTTTTTTNGCWHGVFRGFASRVARGPRGGAGVLLVRRVLFFDCFACNPMMCV